MPRHEGHVRADRIVAAVRVLCGQPFRPRGRGPGGLDCLGVALVAAGAAGLKLDVGPIAMRGTGLADARGMLAAAGCRRLAWREAAAGDLLLSGPATWQVHLAVRSGAGVVEAHALLRRVVERPLAESDGWDSAWRFPEGD